MLASFIVAFVALLVLAAWTVAPDRGPGVEAAIRPAATDPALRLLADQLACPESGRDEGPAGVAWPQLAEPDRPANTIRGQAIPFEILLSVPETPSDSDRVGFELDLTPARDPGPAGFDPDQGIVCAFVDTGDPLTNDSATPASLALDPADESDGSRFSVNGLDPGDVVVVEAWGVLTSSTAARPGSPTATLRPRSSPGGLRLDVQESVARVPVDFGTGSDSEPLTLSVDDGDLGATPGGSLGYTIEVTNEELQDAVNGVQIIAVPSHLTAVERVEILGDGAGTAACEPEGTDGRVRCSTTHLGPGESVTVAVATTVADRSVSQWLRERGSCTPEDSDICLRVDVTWEGSGAAVDSVSLSEPTAVSGDPVIAVAKYPLSGGPAADEPAAIEYAVISATSTPLSAVTVSDGGCQAVTFLDGDTDGDQLLDPDEEWRFRCVGPNDLAGTSRAAVRASQGVLTVGDVAVPNR